MRIRDETQSPPTETTSEASSETPHLTKQLRQELNKRLRKLNKLIVETAYISVPEHYKSRPLKRRMMRDQVKHTKEMLKTMEISEQVLLLEELRSSDESDEPKLILPDGVKKEKE